MMDTAKHVNSEDQGTVDDKISNEVSMFFFDRRSVFRPPYVFHFIGHSYLPWQSHAGLMCGDCII